ncbi:hypothetical protein DFJ66_4381 [Saccharothrix variisporea]|uniref:Uncharacterized protein n=1 Tax=Saccharothrix variisporea TaxID=543527 RepID=A0A495XEQ8_9PSEU|nr:hypothetical protein DFJ66_4381 [Saccharothrix variisporea]
MRELRAPRARNSSGVTTAVRRAAGGRNGVTAAGERTAGERKGVGRPLPPPHHPSP